MNPGPVTCPVCGEMFRPGDDLTSDYDDSLVHFRCGPDSPRGGPMSDEPITGTLAVHVLSESLRLSEEKLAKAEEKREKLEDEADGYVMDIARLTGEIRRLREDAEGYFQANQSLFADKARLIREITLLQSERAEGWGR